MIIVKGSPHLERLPYDFRGMSSLQQIWYKWNNPPKYKILDNKFIVEVTNDLDPDGPSLKLIGPQDFVIDGASVPRILWPIISPTGPLLEGATLHDLFYQYGYLLAIYEEGTPYNCRSLQLREKYAEQFGPFIPVFVGKGKEWGDDLLRQITIAKHGATVDAQRAYRALRIFGHRAFNKYREKGPGAYNQNSLNLPWVNNWGGVEF